MLISTIEHIALKGYDQTLLDDDGDIKTINELYRILKPGGYLFITTPYIGTDIFKEDSFERNYNEKRLFKLVEDFEIIEEEYFYPQKFGKKYQWIKMDRLKTRNKKFKNPGIACLVLIKSSACTPPRQAT
jgi:predicted SAM-dependent methyltransferase